MKECGAECSWARVVMKSANFGCFAWLALLSRVMTVKASVMDGFSNSATIISLVQAKKELGVSVSTLARLVMKSTKVGSCFLLTLLSRVMAVKASIMDGFSLSAMIISWVISIKECGAECSWARVVMKSAKFGCSALSNLLERVI